MRRPLFNAVCLLSLVLAVAVAALWVSSLNTPVWAGRLGIRVDPSPVARISASGIVSFRGRLSLGTRSRDETSSGSPFTHEMLKWTTQTPRITGMVHALDGGSTSYGGFGFVRYAPGWQLFLPHWFLCLLTAVYPAVWLASTPRRRRQRRRALGLCPRCGYDLRGSPGGGGAPGRACPECGEATAVPAADSK